LSAAIYRETEGNPFFVEEVVKSLIEQGDIYRSAGAWDRKAVTDLGLPQSIKEAVGRRLSRLSPACVDVLHTAAALGKLFAFEELAASLTIGEDQLLDALDEAAAAQLIRAESGAAFAFTHDKIREVLYQELNPIRCRRLHQRIGEALEKLYASDLARAPHVPDLAHHFVQSHDLERALNYSVQAGAQAQQLFALEDAQRHYLHALETAQALNLTDRAAAIERDLGDVNAQRGLYHLAVEHYQRALAAMPSERVSLNTRIGLAYTQIGDQRGLDHLHAAERELDTATHAHDLALVLSGLGRFHHYRAEHRRAIEFIERARAIAEASPRAHGALESIYANLAGAYQHLTEYALSRQWAEALVALGEQSGDLATIAMGHEFLSEDYMNQGHWALAFEHTNRNAELAEQSGALDRAAWAEFARAWGLHGSGDLAESRTAGQASLNLAEQIGEDRLAAMCGPIIALAETDLGHDDNARAAAERAMRRTEQFGQLFLRCLGWHGLGYFHTQRGEWAQAAALYARLRELYAPTDNRVVALYSGPWYAVALMHLGQLDQAAAELAHYQAIARFAEAPHWLGLGRRVEGQLLAAQGQRAAALLAFDDALAILEPLGSRLETGRAYYHRALFHRAEGNPDSAANDLEQAKAFFTRCAAARDLARLTS
jgi:tetratricopeptide (TPR) repeat protein